MTEFGSLYYNKSYETELHNVNQISLRAGTIWLFFWTGWRNSFFFSENTRIFLNDWGNAADHVGRAVWGVDLRPLVCWDCGFESRRRHGSLSLGGVVCCQVEACATVWSLVERSPTECDMSDCDRETLTVRRTWSTRGCHTMKKVRES
jgi:hypothetical protein